MHIVNASQDRAWNGPEGRHWAAHADGLNAEITDHLVAAAELDRGDRVLDIGCGTGASSRAAARLVADGEVVGLDLSAPMLAKAAQLAERQGLGNVRFVRGDAQVEPLPAGRFDAAISQYGTVFFSDPVAAFANIGRALRPGGRLTFVCPQPAEDNEWFQVPMGALLPAAPRRTPNEGMFSLADAEHTRRILVAAGYAQVRHRRFTASITFGADVAAAVAFFAGSGPALALIESGAVTEAGIRAALEPALGRYAGPAGVRVPGQHWLVQATWPGGTGHR